MSFVEAMRRMGDARQSFKRSRLADLIDPERYGGDAQGG